MINQKIHAPLTIARYFLGKKECNHIKLHKLVYLAYCYHMTAYGGTPIVYERPEIWKYGVVFPGLYNDLYHHKGAEINIKDVPNKYNDIIDQNNNIRTADFLQIMWRWYGGMCSIDLSTLTSKKGTPWDIQIYVGAISEDIILIYYKQPLYKDKLKFLREHDYEC